MVIFMENYIFVIVNMLAYADVENALHSESKFENVEKAFEEFRKSNVQQGCGGCHGKIMDTISQIMNKKFKYCLKRRLYDEKICMSLRICLRS